MIVTLRMPRLGETMEEATLSCWLVEVGQAFRRGDALVEFETDKTAVEYPALGPGRLAEVLAAPGELVKLGAAIARIELEGSEDWVSDDCGPGDDTAPDENDPDENASNDDTHSDDDTHVEASGTQSETSPEMPPVALPSSTAPPSPLDTPVFRATPQARCAARRAGLELHQLRGSGRRGRIELEDVEAARAGSKAGLASTSWGPPHGTAVTLVHGFAGDRLTFEQLGMGLARANFCATAVDLPAHGQTLIDAHEFEDLVEALAAHLPSRRPVHLVAHSLGAAVAVRATEKQAGVASLTLIAPAGLGVSIDAEFITGMAEAASPGSVGHLLRRLSGRANGFSEALITSIHTDLARGRLRELARSIVSGGGRQTLNVRSTLAELAERIPIRIIVGHRDRIIDWQDALDISPLIRLHHFPDAGHMPHWDEPARVLAIINHGIQHG